MPRVVSLLPSSTEVVCALGRGGDLVGRSHECDYPAWVSRLPVCSEPKFKTRGTGREIHNRVQELVEKSLSVYRVDAEKIKDLKPEVVLTQDHCQVCAVTLDEVQAAVCTWTGTAPKIVSLRPDALADVWQGVRRIGEALGCLPEAETLIGQCETRMAAIARKTSALERRPAVGCIEWMDPLMAAGNWMPELVRMAGGWDVFGEPGAHAPRLTWNQLLEKDPDVLMVLCCGWSLEKNAQEMPVLTQLESWRDLKAVRNGQVYLTEGNQYFNRPGPRLVESLEILAEILHPGVFSFGHEGSGWKKFV